MQVLELVPPEWVLPCVEAGPDLYFSESPRELERAKRLCLPCPLRAACLAGAKERREPWGVWGGEVFVDGHPVPFKRSRGRPRKHPLPIDCDERQRQAEAC
jgi:WhiB family redox-sensing transcriptional regulator